MARLQAGLNDDVAAGRIDADAADLESDYHVVGVNADGVSGLTDTPSSRHQARRADQPPLESAAADEDDGGRVAGKKLPKLVGELAALYGTLGALIFLLDQTDGQIIMAGAEDRAAELVAVAKHHPQMMRVLKQMTQSNAYIALAVGHGGVLVAILQHHGVIPAGRLLSGGGRPALGQSPAATPTVSHPAPAPTAPAPTRDQIIVAARQAGANAAQIDAALRQLGHAPLSANGGSAAAAANAVNPATLALEVRR